MNVCHEEFIRFNGRSVGCGKCNVVLYDEVNDFLKELKPHFSLYYAQTYAQQTGNLDFKCKIPIENIPDVLPMREIFVRYDTLVQTVRLLGMMNKPFVSYENVDMFERNGTLNVKIVENFFDKFQKLIDAEDETTEVQSNMTRDDKCQFVNALKAVHAYVSKMSQGVNVIDQFFDVFAPYAWSFDPAPAESKRMEEPQLLVSVLRQVNRDAAAVRARYGRYSLQFEIIYVVVYVLMLSDDVDAIVSLILSLLARMCKGYFVRPMHEECRNLLINKLKRSVRNSTTLQSKIKLLRTGRCRDYVSIDLLRDVKTLQELFDKEFETYWCSRRETCRSEKIVAYAETQVFPSMLFADDAQYYGFMLVIPLLIKHYDKKNDVLQKNVTSKAKFLIDVVERFVYKMRDYEDPDYWTSDAFKLFVGSDETMKDSVQDIFKCLLMEESLF